MRGSRCEKCCDATTQTSAAPRRCSERRPCSWRGPCGRCLRKARGKTGGRSRRSLRSSQAIPETSRTCTETAPRSRPTGRPCRWPSATRREGLSTLQVRKYLTSDTPFTPNNNVDSETLRGAQSEKLKFGDCLLFNIVIGGEGRSAYHMSDVSYCSC